jgi:hypothetical protein
MRMPHGKLCIKCLKIIQEVQASCRSKFNANTMEKKRELFWTIKAQYVECFFFTHPPPSNNIAPN